MKAIKGKGKKKKENKGLMFWGLCSVHLLLLGESENSTKDTIREKVSATFNATLLSRDSPANLEVSWSTGMEVEIISSIH